jgi:hypothetical protein
MSIYKILAVGLVFSGAVAGWFVLGRTTEVRSGDTSRSLSHQVRDLWGEPLRQEAPRFSVQVPGAQQPRPLSPASNTVRVNLNLEHRKKGLIWYPTYTCDFDGGYTITNDEDVAQKVRMQFSFPSISGTYDAFRIALDGKPLDAPVDTRTGVAEIVELAPGESRTLQVGYRTRGIGRWEYAPDPQVGRVKDLNLTVNTNFEKVDYPDGALSPMSVEETDAGLQLAWKVEDLLTRESIGVIVPERINPGPLVSRITYFAPVCLLFFFVLVGTINILFSVNIHPMHYLFVAAGFFAFHLLLAYMAGLINVHLAFAISAVVSVTLVTGYLSAALKGRFPWKVAVAGQVFFLVLFSYSFFFKGITGLTVAVGSVVTLAVLMKVTAHVDWDKVFEQAHKVRPTPPPLPTEGKPAEGGAS